MKKYNVFLYSKEYQSETGKSYFLKQIEALHTDQITDQDIEMLQEAIYTEIIKCNAIIYQELQNSFKNIPTKMFFKKNSSAKFFKEDSYSDEFYDDIVKFYNDPQVKELYLNILSRKSIYIINNIDRFQPSNFSAIMEDYIQIYFPTNNIVKKLIKVGKSNKIVFMDIGNIETIFKFASKDQIEVNNEDKRFIRKKIKEEGCMIYFLNLNCIFRSTKYGTPNMLETVLETIKKDYLLSNANHNLKIILLLTHYDEFIFKTSILKNRDDYVECLRKIDPEYILDYIVKSFKASFPIKNHVNIIVANLNNHVHILKIYNRLLSILFENLIFQDIYIIDSIRVTMEITSKTSDLSFKFE